MVCSAFRTVSHDAALVISGGIQIDLLTVESANIRAGSTGVATAESLLKRCRELTIAKWQERWVLNSGTKPTFSRAGTSSIIDLTFVNAGLASGSSWEVSDTYTSSDHAAIICTINSRNGLRPRQGTK